MEQVYFAKNSNTIMKLLIIGAIPIALIMILISCNSSQVEHEELTKPKDADLISRNVVNVYAYKIQNPTENNQVKVLITSLQNLPKRVQDILVVNKYEIFFIKNFSDVSMNTNDNISGKHDPKNKIIMLKIESIDYLNTLIHEVGHAFDYNNNSQKDQYSSNSDFIIDWKEESKKLFTKDVMPTGNDAYFSHVSDDPAEYFAECFAFYLNNELTRNNLQKYAPKTYKYLERILHT
ncbi:hypothetical protein LJR153_007385 [Paenibacillus sp. LjRoot153]|uniref:anthrax toxin lethal factor-related metalloendopeptidase n=1 Tax=Paenibacillus sp. LjRoot153 TaxID=3342270 RepID=UPI003ED00564